MTKQLEAVYENGVLRPLEPLALADHQRVLLIVNDIPDYKEWARAQLSELGAPPGLSEVHRLVASIRGSVSDVIAEEREER